MAEGDSIAAMVNRALRGPKVMVANPETIEKAMMKGESVGVVPELPSEQAIDKLFEHRRSKAQLAAPDLPGCPVPDAPILHLYDQIRQCILFDLTGPAITMCGMLVEYALKYAMFAAETRGASTFDADKWRPFERLTLTPAINQAAKVRLIAKEDAKRLRKFADLLRNPYSHFNLQKLTEAVVFGNVEETDFETGETKIIELPPSTPTLQVLAKEALDEKFVLPVFLFCDDVVRKLFTQLEAQHEAPA